MKTWNQDNILKESQVQKDLDKMTYDLYFALCRVYDKWKGSSYNVSDVIDLCIEEALERAKEANQ